MLSLSPTQIRGPRFEFDRWVVRRRSTSGIRCSRWAVPRGLLETPISPDRLIASHERGIAFESFFISTGSSGGTLFNRYSEVLGLVVEKRAPRAGP